MRIEITTKIQLEPSNKNHTYIKRWEDWFLFDDVENRNDFSSKQHYKLTYSIADKKSFCETDVETIVCDDDSEANNIDMCDYILLAQLLKFNGKYIFNKKIGKAIPKETLGIPY